MTARCNRHIIAVAPDGRGGAEFRVARHSHHFRDIAIGCIIGGLVYWKLRKGKFNPIVGIAGVSCLPTTAKVAQHAAFEANKFNMILPIATGPSVAGVITSSIITGIYVSAIGLIR